jgi:hypothetical protein
MCTIVLQVRVAIASQLHLVSATVVPAEASRLLLRPLVALLRDGCPAVRQALLPELGQTLQVRCRAAPLRMYVLREVIMWVLYRKHPT